MPDLDVNPRRIAFDLVLLGLAGRDAVDRHLREVHGIDPTETDRVDRLDLTRRHLMAHGVSVTDDGVISWPVEQHPHLRCLLPGTAPGARGLVPGPTDDDVLISVSPGHALGDEP